MSYDFSYNKTTITSSGGFKPSEQNVPLDVRTIVNKFAEITEIPNPFVGMNITVKMDESNNNKMTDYKVTALKTAGLVQVVDVENGLVRMKDYLDASGGSSVDFVDNLDSESATKALSANQGRVLNQIKANKADLVADYATKDYVIANI